MDNKPIPEGIRKLTDWFLNSSRFCVCKATETLAMDFLPVIKLIMGRRCKKPTKIDFDLYMLARRLADQVSLTYKLMFVQENTDQLIDGVDLVLIFTRFNCGLLKDNKSIVTCFVYNKDGYYYLRYKKGQNPFLKYPNYKQKLL